ncbi:glycosyltransferase family 39 protein [Streptomyces sp. SPB162]|uniref:ArnT family glycosyltransferase n=1 Tax=Streptomyces sp. SPB162 TaxID=2940560 RepID=UPI002404D4AA|nr:glycosyltransferase family 39 protein [Streptomyces sp. SPB162]MDF9814270.1 4-amino-4-deoxy-L-arabinose transferase-like glycosyltransferase [Streptomyces sp. SPB162]
MTAPYSTPADLPAAGPPPHPAELPGPVTRTPVPEHAPPPGAPPAAGPPGPDGPRGFAARVRRGRSEDARWVRPAFLALLAVTAALYLWDLSASGYANSFYSAAVQAGSESWKAMFFGSSDAANSITVDKPPASLWPMEIAVRIFGLNSWSVLVPEALMGVATVGVLYAAVRRRFGPAAGLIAGAALAITPVAALMFRFNNPDAMLALLMTVAVYCVLRALEGARTTWLVWAGVAFGLAFLTKTLQAFLILPPLAIVYAVVAPTAFRRRIGQLALAGLALLVSGGWWVAIVELWPASSRPYIGGSQDNSFLSLTFGYNGFGRITGDETGSVGGGGGGAGGGGGMWGSTGITRLFDADMGGQIAWLLPAAFALLLAGLWLTRRAPRTDARRAAFLVWGGSLLMTFGIFSFMSGIFHQYYNIALAPYIAAVVGMGATLLWEKRAHIAAATALAATAAGTGYWAYVLLGRASDWHPWLRWTVLVAGLVAAAGLLLAVRLGRRAAAAVAGFGIAAALAAPFAYTLNTVDTGHSGSIVTAGPAVQGGMGGPGGMRGGGPDGMPGRAGQNGRTLPGGQRPPGMQGGGRNGGQPGQNGGAGQQPGQQGQPGQGTQVFPGGGTTGGDGGTAGGRGNGGMGGLLGGVTVSSAMKALLEQNASDYTWVAAAIGSQNSAGYQLATGDPVMAIGGFNGSDPSPTLAQFQQYVAEGRIHYFISSGGMGGGGMGGQGTSSAITTWVTSTFTAKTVGTTTVYDLTAPAKS